MRVLLFLFYLANYTVIVFFNVAFAHIALSHLTGGNATLSDGIAVARSRIIAILQWAALASIAGIIMKLVSDEDRLGRTIGAWLGYAWHLATFFVTPLLALQDIGPGEALYRSADIFQQKWGELMIAQYSFSLLFFVLGSPALGFFFFAGLVGQTFGMLSVAAMAYLWFLAAIVFSAEQVFTAAIYLYATKGTIAKGFSHSDFLKAWGLPSEITLGV